MNRQFNLYLIREEILKFNEYKKKSSFKYFYILCKPNYYLIKIKQS